MNADLFGAHANAGGRMKKRESSHAKGSWDKVPSLAYIRQTRQKKELEKGRGCREDICAIGEVWVKALPF